ncbi:MAG: peptidylprolyl isomerase, partial [Spirochaetaceae bacterium]|nr:peptidylprolyl isomerase [Spirochaetaceae bacterium]
MRRRKLFVTGILIVLRGIAFGQQPIDQTVARVRLTRPEVITQRQLRSHIEVIENQTRQSMPLEERRRMLDLQVGEILITQAAARDNFRVTDNELNESIARYKQQMAPNTSDAQFRTVVQNQMGMSWEDFTASVRKRLVQEKYILEKRRAFFNEIREPSDSEVQQIFEANATEFSNPQLVRFNQIFFATRGLSEAEKQQARRRADDALAELRTSQFKDVVLKYSDDTTSKYKGGDAGYLARNDNQRLAIMGRTFFDT